MLQSNANFSGFASAGSRMTSSAGVQGPHSNMITCMQVKSQDARMVKELSTSGRGVGGN